MKILSRYVLKEHLAPFLFAFLVITFLLVIEYVPKIIDHVIDKDLSVWVALELIVLNLAWMLALSVPMSVLVATLMAFGRLTSDFEVTAVKASGINLLRILFPLLVAGGVITWLMIEFNDRVLPDLNREARLLWQDISAMRPTLVFKSGIFVTDIPGHLVLIEDVDHATSRVEGVIISRTKDPTKQDLVVAEYGYLEMLDGGKSMQFTLYNGEAHSFDTKDPDRHQILDFEEQVYTITGTGSELKRTESNYRGDREMPIAAMQERVDRAHNATVPLRSTINKRLMSKFDYLFGDSFVYNASDTVSDSTALEYIKSDAAVLDRQLERSGTQISAQQKLVHRYDLEIYKKYSIPAASLAFILVGAPLAILSRRGGMGIAIAISIALFVFYWAFLIAGESLSDRRLISPFWAMWGANFLLGWLGVYLLYIVVSERPLFGLVRQIFGRGGNAEKA